MLRPAATIIAFGLLASCAAADSGANDLPLRYESRTPPAITQTNCGNQPTPGTNSFNPDVCQIVVEPYALSAEDGSTATVTTPRFWWEPTDRVALEFDCPLAPERDTPVSRWIPYLDGEPQISIDLDDGAQATLLPTERLAVGDCFQQSGSWIGQSGPLRGQTGTFVETYNGLQLTMELSAAE